MLDQIRVIQYRGSRIKGRSRSRPRVKLSMNRFQLLLVDMCVNLGRGNVGMAKHFLNNPQIRAIAEQMRGETVAEQMRINVFF